MSNNRALVGACLAAFFSLVHAGDVRATIFGSIHGSVRDAEHHPVSSATIALQAETADRHVVTITDSDGRYAFTAVPLGLAGGLFGGLFGGSEHGGVRLVSVMLMRNFARGASAVEHEA